MAMAAMLAKLQRPKDEVNVSVKLGDDLNVDQTPMLAINGHLLPMGGIPYETSAQDCGVSGRARWHHGTPTALADWFEVGKWSPQGRLR